MSYIRAVNVSGEPVAKRSALALAEAAIPEGSVVEAIIEAVKDGIKAGRFVPGQRLIETDIREIVGSGRGSVREAMRRLAADGIVDLEHQKGARVRRMSRAEAQSIYQAREALEGMAARLAAEHIDRQDYRARLLTVEKSFGRNSDGSAHTYLRYNEQFHRLIMTMSENWHIIRMVEQLQVPAFLLVGRVMSNRETIDEARAEHHPIVEAILAGDPKRAEATMRAHIKRSGVSVISRAQVLD